MTPVDKLIQSIQQVLDSGTPSQNMDKLAMDFAQWCSSTNRRLEQCERLLEGKAEHEALQLAETSPSLLDLCAALSFDRVEQWRGLCRAKNLPLPETLNERAISQLNDLYAKGITSSHPLYRDYRRAVAERDDERALTIIRSIVRLNPSDANARHEIQRLEGKARDAACGRLVAAVQSQNSAGMLSALEEVEEAGWVGAVNSAVLNQARAIRQERDRESAFARCCGLVTILDRMKDRETWTEALGPIREVEQLCEKHGISLNTEVTQTFDEVRSWAYDSKKVHDAEQELQAALQNMAFLLEKGEANDGPGAPHNLQSLREEQHELVNQWRELESFAKPVSEDLQTRVKRRSAILQAEISRLVRQRRLVTTIGIGAVVIVAGVATVLLFRWRWSNGQIADLEKLQQDRRVVASEKFIADLRRSDPTAVTQSRLALEIQKADQWISLERQRTETFRTMLGKLERHQQSGFKDASIEIIAKDWQQVQDFKKELAPEFRDTGEAALLEFENQFDALVQTLKREAEGVFQKGLKGAEGIAATLEQPELTLPVVRQTVTALVGAIEHLETLAKPVAVKLPVSLTDRIEPLKARVIPYQAALAKLDKADADLQQATTLDLFYSALESYDAEHLRHLSSIRAARKVGSAKLTLMDVERLVLMPNDMESWGAFLKNPNPTSPPPEVMPAELSKWLSIRDDDNLRDVYRYQMPVTEDGFPVCSPTVRRGMVYTRSPWRKPYVDSLGLHFSAVAFVPADDSTLAEFSDTKFLCKCNSRQPLTDEEIARLVEPTPESGLLKRIGLDVWINDAGDKFRRPLLQLLDELREGEKISPLFKAYVHWRLLEIEAIRPAEWGARVAPSIESDRVGLKDLGITELRSGDWMIPVRIQKWEAKLAGFYNRTRSVGYTKQARFFERLLSEAHAAGMKFAGYVDADGKPILTSEGSRSQQLWGLSEAGQQLTLLWSSKTSEGPSLVKPQPLSPLFFCGRQTSEILKATSEKAQIDWQSDAIKNYLPPLFQVGLKQ